MKHYGSRREPRRPGIVEPHFDQSGAVLPDAVQPGDERQVAPRVADSPPDGGVGLAAGQGGLRPLRRRVRLRPLLLPLQPIHVLQDQLDLARDPGLPRRMVTHHPAAPAAQHGDDGQQCDGRRRHRRPVPSPPLAQRCSGLGRLARIGRSSSQRRRSSAISLAVP